MSKSCTLKQNPASGKWEALFADRVLAASHDKEYIVRVIEGGFSKKARNLGVTKCFELNALVVNDNMLIGDEMDELQTVEAEFSINERFKIVEDYVDMVANKHLASALITGEGGLGKSHTVMKSLRSSGLKDISTLEIGARLNGPFKGYLIVKGYSTPKGLFRTLYENRDQVVVFDDCDSVLRDPTAVNLLKAALDSYDQRVISWNAEGLGDDDLPKTFEFTGGVIFISNLSKLKIPQSIRSRAMCADVSMTRAECIERMHVIARSEDFMSSYELEHKLEALEFVAENANNPLINELNLRSLINVVKARTSKPEHWKRLGLYSMVNG